MARSSSITGVLTFTENYLKPECEILEYDKAKVAHQGTVD
jgi:hypothetical protein